MDYVGDNVSADIEIVWEAGQTHFPAIAVSYATAAQSLDGGDSGGGGGVMGQWASVKDYLQQRMSKSAEALEDTGTALREAAESLGATDSEAGAALDAIKEELGDEPVDIPNAPMPDHVQGPTEGNWN